MEFEFLPSRIPRVLELQGLGFGVHAGELRLLGGGGGRRKQHEGLSSGDSMWEPSRPQSLAVPPTETYAENSV